MQTSRLTKRILKLLPFLVVIVFAVAALFISKDVDRTPISTSVKANTPTLVLVQQSTPELPKVIATVGPCASGIYLSLPPKCKTLDGKFIPVPGAPSNFFVIPGPK